MQFDELLTSSASVMTYIIARINDTNIEFVKDRIERRCNLKKMDTEKVAKKAQNQFLLLIISRYVIKNQNRRICGQDSCSYRRRSHLITLTQTLRVITQATQKQMV